VTPTRELCLQVAEGVAEAGQDAGVKVVPIVGGRPIGPQIVALSKGSQVVVGTPGRLLDHLRQRTLDLSNVSVVVLDEADEMLDLGFLPDVEQILKATPAHRQTMLFSATMPTEVVNLARRYMRQPTFVRAQSDNDSQLVPATEQHFFQVHPLDRFQVLCRVLDTPKRERVAVFRRTKRGVDRTISGLKERGYKAGALHGDLPQHAREKVLAQFRKGKLDVLVSTDVAARGLDIAGLSHVVNYDTPEDEKAYVHRIGRTGRAGAAGMAITFVAWNERMTADLIRERLGLTDLQVHEVYSTSPMLTELFGLPAPAEPATPREATAGKRRRRAQAPAAVVAAETQAVSPEQAVSAERPAARTVRRRRRRGFSVETTHAQPAQSAQSA
jgi:superfamily II DNA/RNA helicase